MFAKLSLIFSLSLVFVSCTREKTEFVSIGTGGVTGVYYPTGGALARMLNDRRDEFGIRASYESTGGSVFNVNALMSGEMEFGIVQSDRQFQAYRGLAEWESAGPQKDLRAVFSLHTEAVTLVAAVEAGIESLHDLKGKRVNIGNPGSGQRGNSLDVLRAASIDFESELQAESLDAAEAPRMLQDNRIDAFFYTVGHPSGAITEATSGNRKVRFVPIVGMEDLLREFPYYAVTHIPHALYPMAEGDSDIPSIGVKATLVTSSQVSEDTVYALTKSVFENLDSFKRLHPAFHELEKANMLQGISVPFHPGALRYFEEVGLVDQIPAHLLPNL
ncbi:MAG: TAXI family TRAP transporter solute-binding subunit [Bradymonadales bacterium]|nr:MAG: TAXI family TRAP transporter solute-binding subunit [Bradymonadales bacterium]